MKYQLFSFSPGPGTVKTGLLVQGKQFDLASLAVGLGEPLLDRSIDQFLEDWLNSHELLKSCALQLGSPHAAALPAALAQEIVVFEPPLKRPGMMYAAGANYRDHAEAMGRAFGMKLMLDPKAEGIDPWHFVKGGRGTLVGGGHDVAYPKHTEKFDWEAELAVVIGTSALNVDTDSALLHVAGYTCANDLSARDNLVRQKVDPTSPFRFDWIGHKCFTGACPLGPYFTPAEFVGSPEDLAIQLSINGELKQDSNTSNHLYGVAEQISYLSKRLELYPGDVILTGTPAGVGMESGTFLKRGDEMCVRIEGLGELRNRIV
jgi:2-keto-4-pentenoate hydratase/2-oxohepta-3-ene-1,7-dioic acid hydratase in catechol pathway